MKATTREWLAQLDRNDGTYLDPEGFARDALDSDARLRTEVRQLRAAWREASDLFAANCWCDPDMSRRCAAHQTMVDALAPRRKVTR